jgi:hypothetical protein
LRARARLAALTAIGMAALAAGCELAEVTTQPGEEVLVVEAVLRTAAIQQRILLHPSLVAGTPSGMELGARVVVRTETGREIVFAQTDLAACLEDETRLRAACYMSRTGEGYWVQAGREYELSVTTTDGRRLFGRTRVPGTFQVRQPAMPPGSARVCRLPPDTPLPLVWTRAAGAWSYVTEMEIRNLRSALGDRISREIPEPLSLLGLSISEADTTMVLPGDFGVFQRTDFEQPLLRALQGGLPSGVTARVILAAADRNYVNAVRGGSFNPAGRVRIPSVAGDGTGFFGSLSITDLTIDVRPGSGARPCLADR